jgi:hypothetical protein
MPPGRGRTPVCRALLPGLLPLSLEPPFSDEGLQQLQVDEVGPNTQDLGGEELVELTREAPYPGSG